MCSLLRVLSFSRGPGFHLGLEKGYPDLEIFSQPSGKYWDSKVTLPCGIHGSEDADGLEGIEECVSRYRSRNSNLTVSW
jgi:hypothetical protein